MARNGCISLDGVLRIQVSRPFAQSTVSRILALVEQSDRNKSRSETFIRRFARIYTPAVVAAAAALAVLPPLILGGGWGGWVRRALTFLVISCPCALVISVPLTFFAGIGGASRKGILIKGSRFVETLARAEVVAFDKTGTLTKGAFQVREVQPEGFSREELLELAAAAERHSSHPISRCLVEEARPGAAGRKVTDVQELSGLGIRATVDGRAVQVGNARLMEEAGIPLPGSVPDAPGTTVYVAVDGSYAGRIVVSDQAKEEAGTLVPALKALGVRSCVMLTGDREAAARPLAEELGMDRVLAELSPEDKVNQMGRLKQELSGKGRLVYVGDGINDAPVLARADAGIAMGAFGSDAAVEAADVVLMDDNPAHVPGAIAIARRTMAIARQNIAFALGIKAVVLVLGAMGLAPLWASVFADVGVCLLCILNALRAMVPEPSPAGLRSGPSGPARTENTPGDGHVRLPGVWLLRCVIRQAVSLPRSPWAGVCRIAGRGGRVSSPRPLPRLPGAASLPGLPSRAGGFRPLAAGICVRRGGQFPGWRHPEPAGSGPPARRVLRQAGPLSPAVPRQPPLSPPGPCPAPAAPALVPAALAALRRGGLLLYRLGK